MRAVLSTRSTDSAIGNGGMGIAITGGARVARMGWGVGGVGGSLVLGMRLSIRVWRSSVSSGL